MTIQKGKVVLHDDEEAYYVITVTKAHDEQGEITTITKFRDWHNALHEYVAWEGSALGSCIFGATTLRSYFSFGQEIDPEAAIAAWLLTSS